MFKPAASDDALQRVRTKEMQQLPSDASASSLPLPQLQPGQPKGSAFWLCFLAMVVCNILSALDVTAVSTILPTVTHDLGGDNDFVWVGAAYGLASTAALPFCGRLADVFGRRPVMLMAVAFFFVGSALCGSAKSMNILILGRSKILIVYTFAMFTYVRISYSGYWWRSDQHYVLHHSL